MKLVITTNEFKSAVIQIEANTMFEKLKLNLLNDTFIGKKIKEIQSDLSNKTDAVSIAMIGNEIVVEICEDLVIDLIKEYGSVIKGLNMILTASSINFSKIFEKYAKKTENNINKFDHDAFHQIIKEFRSDAPADLKNDEYNNVWTNVATQIDIAHNQFDLYTLVQLLKSEIIQVCDKEQVPYINNEHFPFQIKVGENVVYMDADFDENDLLINEIKFVKHLVESAYKLFKKNQIK